MILATITGILLIGSGSLVPSEQGVSVPLGSTATLPIVVTDSTGAAVDLTGGSLTLTARDQTLAPILQTAATLTSPIGGLAQFDISASQWAAIQQGAYTYDVWYQSAAGSWAQVVVPGLFLVTRRVPDLGFVPPGPTPPPFPNARTQTTWHWDWVNGNDANDGLTAQTPIKTWACKPDGSVGAYIGRVGTDTLWNFAVDVYIAYNATPMPPTDMLAFFGEPGPNFQVRVHGVPAIKRSGTITAKQDRDPPTNKRDEITDSGVSDWTSDVLYMLEVQTSATRNFEGNIVSGPTRAIVAKALTGPVRAGMSVLQSKNFTPANSLATYPGPFPVGATYTILKLPTVDTLYLDPRLSVGTVNRANQSYMELLNFSPTTADPTFGGWQYYDCTMDLMVGDAGEFQPTFFNCLSRYATFWTGNIQVWYGLMGPGCSASGNGTMISFGLMMQGPACQIAAGISQGTGQGMYITNHHNSFGIGVFDCDTPFQISGPAAILHESSVYGTGNTTCIYNLAQGAYVADSTPYTTPRPYCTAAGPSDIIINGQTALPPIDPVTFAFAGSARPLTFANLHATVANGGFQGRVSDPGSPGTRYEFAFATPGPDVLQLTWFVDAQNSSGLASNANTGLTSGAPLLTNREIPLRLGTTSPDLGSANAVLTINQLSDTNAGDPVNLTPKQGAVVVVAPLTQVATGTLSAVTARNQGPVGAAKWNITTASFGSWTPYLNCLVQDTTTASWFVVEADTGGGSATVTQPTKDTRQVSMTASGGRTLTFNAAAHTIAGSSGSFVTDGFTAGQILIISGTTSNNGNAGIIATVAAGLITLNSGIVNEGPLSSAATLTTVGVVLNSLVTPLVNDAFTVWQPGVVHVTDLGGVSVNGAVIIQNANVTPIVPGYTINLYGGVVAQHCIFSGYIAASSLALEAATGNNQSGKPAFTNCVALKGGDLFDYYWMGGAIWGSFVLRAEGSQALLGGGVYLNGTTTPMSFTGGGRHQIGDVGIFTSPATALNLLGGGQGRQTTGVISSGTDPCTGATAAIWGTTNWPIKSFGNHALKVGAAAELKVNGSITLCGASSGATYTPSTGVTTANTAVTLGSNSTGQASAAIDAAISGGATGVIAPGNFAGIIKEA